jgi:transposase-like protein
MIKVEAVCPYYKKQIVVEKNHFGVGEHAHRLQDIQCSHCSKSRTEDLSVTLAKSAPALSGELAELRVQVRGQLDQLMTKINALVANGGPANEV